MREREKTATAWPFYLTPQPPEPLAGLFGEQICSSRVSKRCLWGRISLGLFQDGWLQGPYLRRNDYNGLALRLRSGLRQHKRGMRGILQAHLPFWPSLALFEIETSTWPRAPPFRLDPLVVLAIYSIALEYLIWFLGIGLTARGLTANLTQFSAQV